MAQFIDPSTDTGFKIIFGKEDASNEILSMETIQFTSHQDTFNSLANVGNLAAITPQEHMNSWSPQILVNNSLLSPQATSK